MVANPIIKIVVSGLNKYLNDLLFFKSNQINKQAEIIIPIIMYLLIINFIEDQ